MEPHKSSDREGTSDQIMQTQRAMFPAPSDVSMKSDRSIVEPPKFSNRPVPSGLKSSEEGNDQLQNQFTCAVCQKLLKDPVSIICGHKFCRQCINSYWDQSSSSGAFGCPQCRKRSRTRPVLHPHKTMEESMQQDSYQTADDVLHRVLHTHKTSMKNKYESLFEGIKSQDSKTLLNRIYTQLYIIEGESAGINEEHEVLQKIPKTQPTQNAPVSWNKYQSLYEGIETQEDKILLDRVYTQISIMEGESKRLNEEHEVLQMVKTHRKRPLNDAQISCNDIFQSSVRPGFEEREDKEDKLKTVLTKGIAGIGKTVSVQKFILDWAEGKANQDVNFMFVLPFRELNLIKDEQYSFQMLLCDFHPEIKDLNSKIYDSHKIVFIFDGLDENRIPLNFFEYEKISDITMTSSVSVLIANLIKGELLPSALIWITSRPAAANQIPLQYIDRVTEIQGFNDPQKEEYFRKKVCDQAQASKIISHIKSTKSLHIMCHIPVFCWMSAVVLQQFLECCINAEIPKTLTEMYIHFLLIQINKKKWKYRKSTERDGKTLLENNRDMILKLAELAFKQLIKGNIMFYEEDLRECGIDVTEASVYSGICTEIFKEESVLYQKKVYCFVHLSFQEFLAALYVFHCFVSKNMEVLNFFKPLYKEWPENVPMEELLKRAVNKALESKDGHLDLFLRFLLGISLESNQRLLQGLLTHTERSSESIDKMITYIQKQIKGEDEMAMEEMTVMIRIIKMMMEKIRQRMHLPTDRSINLFLCLTEMRDQSLSREIQEYLQSEKHRETALSPGQCSALACMLLIADEVQDELNLKKYNTSEEGYRRLIPAITKCRKALLAGCRLTMNSCETMASALQSANSSLKELDLTNNGLKDSGVKLLSAGLNSSHCKLEILRLAACNLTTNSCEMISSSLQSANSCLTELDISYNGLRDSGVELLSDGLNCSHCKLEILRLAGCNLTMKSCETACFTLNSANSSLKELDFSNNDIQDSGVEQLSAGLKSLHCKLQILRLASCSLTASSCETLCATLKSADSSLKEVDLSHNDLRDSGVKHLSDGLSSSQCKLEIFRLCGCLISEEGFSALASVLSLNPSHLKELHLTNNNPGETGVKLFSAALTIPHCKLELLGLAYCSLSVNSIQMLSSALQSAHSPLRGLDLSNNDLHDSGVELLCAGLESSRCKLEIVKLSGCLVTEEGCSYLASALSSNPSHLKELDLTYNNPGDTGVNVLSARLEDPHCKLETLKVAHGGKIRIRPGLSKYACELTLDPNTVHIDLSLSEGNRKATSVREQQPYPDHPERFDVWLQVLCRESLSGRCYWEAEYSGRGAAIAVTYKGISRKGGGDDCRFGYNEKSWRIYCTNNTYSVWHNKKITDIPSPRSSTNRIGVYLDWPAGILSFYIISSDSHTLTHVHTFHTTFTEPLYGGFWVGFDSSVWVSQIE
ncbi:NACHT, LRR and PYD domains-containing protein 3-like isoform X2 [Electrophorus electricus]|uniref:NACHT, LRR and PYD domains-containing protein 3-like isoform X2 n=1 Tax=Electrophorus electricus TaxID=8005 RepID=UPI0015D08764|nr:NACHT, LRR and PYD domains-containing protein 3-like isoform X2 [Electrophorus electricus]XP_035390800.1 NACHT, LRR and PYD domains-containing protein 3-like isoform X2 [Electrophorus electricus]